MVNFYNLIFLTFAQLNLTWKEWTHKNVQKPYVLEEII